MSKIIVLFFLYSLSAFSQSLPEVPALTKPVTDLTGILSSSETEILSAKIFEVYQSGKGPQVAVLVIPTLNDYPLESAANEIFNTWGIGDKDSSDGVLVLVVLNDKKMRIEVGDGLEGSLTDYDSSEIIKGMGSHFRNKDFLGGLNFAVEEIGRIVTKPGAVQTPRAPSPPVDYSLHILISVMIAFVALLGSQITGYVSALKTNKENKEAILKVENEFKKPIVVLTEELKQQAQEKQSVLTSLESRVTALSQEVYNSDFGRYSRLQETLRGKESEKRNMEREAEKLNAIIRKGV